MSEIKDIKMDIAASLFMCPCTEEELLERDFLKNKSKFIIQKLIQQITTDGWIFETKSGLLCCYKKTVKNILNPNGYELG